LANENNEAKAYYSVALSLKDMSPFYHMQYQRRIERDVSLLHKESATLWRVGPYAASGRKGHRRGAWDLPPREGGLVGGLPLAHERDWSVVSKGRCGRVPSGCGSGLALAPSSSPTGGASSPSWLDRPRGAPINTQRVVLAADCTQMYARSTRLGAAPRGERKV
jgi:hypothetical protein